MDGYINRVIAGLTRNPPNRADSVGDCGAEAAMTLTRNPPDCKQPRGGLLRGGRNDGGGTEPRLKWKIFLFLLLFCAILLVILWLFQTVLLNDMYKLIRRHELKQVISYIEKELATIEKEIDLLRLQSIIIRIQSENDILITLTRDFVLPAQRPRFEPQIFGRSNIPFEAVTETKEFKLPNGQTLSLTFYALISPVNATVSTLRMQLYIITGVMIVFSVLIAVAISKRISKPIVDINRNAQTLAKGDYSTRFSGTGFHEIVELSNTLNTAAIELGKVETLRRELLANVSHDLRTPLSLIYSYSEMMHDFPDEITPEQTQVIMEETRRLSTLVNDVLDISKLETDMESLNKTDFSITQAIAETTGRMEELLRKDGYNITFSHDRDARVHADKTKIDRAFYNLLINAVNYAGDNRRIAVEQAVAGENVRISVSDDGEGISEDDLPYIWDRYYKSSKTHKRAVTGTGLGLSIVKKIITLHNGAYGVTTKLGKGSTFWFEIEQRG